MRTITSAEASKAPSFRLRRQIGITGAATCGGLLLWELLKEYGMRLLLPDHVFTRWESHILTILFGTLIASVTAYFVLRGRQQLYESLIFELEENRRTNAKLAQSEERYRLLFDRHLAGVYRSSLDGRVLECNQALAGILGYRSSEEVVSRATAATDSYFNPEERKSKLARLEKDRVINQFEIRLRRKDGTPVWVLENSSLVADEARGTTVIEGTMIDITEHKRLEQQLRQAQKMEAVGRLAGGLAHDFNNLLLVIRGNSELILDRVPADAPVHGQAEQVKKAADRAAELTRQLLAFSRMQVLEPRVLELNNVLQDLGKMLPRLLREDIEVSLRPGASLGRVKADRNQIDQLILNLAANARDAMPNGGKLVIETANEEFHQPDPDRYPGMTAGSYVLLTITDTGVGMDAETQSHIFEPFFTTKEMGKGTGLGLATVYGVVKQSGGWIWVSSEVGKGTSFRIYLPRVEEAVDPLLAARTETPIPRGTETILLVEDQEGVREMTAEFLAGLGYRVLAARHGEEGLQAVRERETKIDLLLTDVVMPKMGGRELAKEAVALDPELVVLYMSANAEFSMPSRPIAAAGEVIAKPFSLAALAAKVRELLDRRRSGSAAGEAKAWSGPEQAARPATLSGESRV